MLTRNVFKTLIFSLLPLCVLVVSIEALLALLGVGRPYERAATFWSGSMHLMQPDKYAGIRMIPNYENELIRLNSLGLWDDELNTAADVKILSLGESCAFGWGLDYKEEGFAAKLEKDLAEKLQKQNHPLSVEVLNAGVPSYTVYQGLQLYLNYLKPVAHWDFVLITFGWNENPGEELDLDFTLKNPPIENKMLRELRSLAKHLHLYNLLEGTYFSAKQNAIKDPYLQAQGQYETYYSQLVRAVRHDGARVIVSAVIIPPNDTSPPAKRMKVFNELARKIAEHEGAYWLDLNPLFFRQRDKIRWFDPIHYDSRGHDLVANALRDLLLDQLRTHPK